MLPRLNEPQSAGVAGGAAIEGFSDVDDGVGAGDERAAEAIDEAEQIFGAVGEIGVQCGFLHPVIASAWNSPVQAGGHVTVGKGA